MTKFNELDGLIVLHIADLQAATQRIQDEIDPRLLREAAAIIEKRALKHEWAYQSDYDGEVVSIALENWVKRDENGEIKWWLPWIELSSMDSGSDAKSASHLSAFLHLQAPSVRKMISLKQDVLSKKKWRALLNQHPKEMQALRNLGFDVDEREGLIALSVRLEATVLKGGFEDDDLTEALKPIETAIDLVAEGMPHFEVLAAAAEIARAQE